MPVPEDLDTRVRLAARAQGVTVAAWVREQLLIAVRHPAAPLPPLSKDDERRIWQLRELPMFYTTANASCLLDLSLHATRRALRAGDLVGHLAHRTVFDPGRRRWLRRTWWRIPADALWAYIARCTEYQWGHGRRPYTRRVADPATPMTPRASRAIPRGPVT